MNKEELRKGIGARQEVFKEIEALEERVRSGHCYGLAEDAINLFFAAKCIKLQDMLTETNARLEKLDKGDLEGDTALRFSSLENKLAESHKLTNVVAVELAAMVENSKMSMNIIGELVVKLGGQASLTADQLAAKRILTKSWIGDGSVLTIMVKPK